MNDAAVWQIFCLTGFITSWSHVKIKVFVPLDILLCKSFGGKFTFVNNKFMFAPKQKDV